MSRSIRSAAGMAALLAAMGFWSLAQAAELKIGLLLSQTGPLSSYGIAMKTAAEYAAKEINDAGGINGNRVTVVAEDDTSNPTTFLNGLNRLIETHKVMALVGPITSGFFQAGAPIAQEKGVLMISPTATAPNLTSGNPMAFRNNPSEDVNIPRLLKRITEIQPGIKTISIVYDNKQAADKIIGGLYETLAPTVGWKVQQVTTFLSGQLNYSDIVTRVLKDKPDVVAAAAHAEDAANVARALRRQGYDGIILGGTPTVSQDYIKIGGEAVNKTYVVVPYYHAAKTAENLRFAAGYRKVSDRDSPDAWEASTYESVGMIAQAMKAAGVTGDASRLAAERRAIRDRLAATKNYPGLIGPISFDGDRVAEKPAVIIHVKDGEWHAL